MANVTLVCGKICSGKTTYARKLCAEQKLVLLSIDEIMLALFGLYAGERHDEWAEKTERYLLDKSAEIAGTGIGVVLDWGFWTKAKRDYAREFFAARNIGCDVHFISISNGEWRRRVEKRNRAVLAGEVSAYLVDEGLAAKFASRFEMPDRSEISVWVDG
ncbi:MAG: ATP-binding protein [Treponema sp.]|nr:ATP-binding protein [Treponema sp.]